MQQPLHQAIVHVDLDAFYAQVEVKQHPALRGKPVGVTQYNPWGSLATHAPDEDRIMNDSNGSLIAVSYEARAHGVKRNMRGDQARAACPVIQLVQVPTAHGKADLTLYRSEGKRVLDILARLGKAERASIDEAYLDLTEEAHRRLEAAGGVPLLPCNPAEQVHVMEEAGFVGAAAWWQRPPQDWQPGERLLACAAAATAELREAVLQELGYTCSAGIAHTKLLAKLCSGLHKPAQQTVLPAVAVPALLGPLPIPKLRGLGAKFGEEVMSQLSISTVGELAAVPLSRLEAVFGGKDAQWLAALARGVTDEVVEERKLAKSVGCSKTFRGNFALKSVDSVRSWLLELAGELSERLEEDREENNRMPQLLTAIWGSQVPWGPAAQGYHSTSRSCPLRKIDADAMADDAAALVRRWAAEQGTGWSIASLGLAAGNFVPVQSAASAITRFFKPVAAPAGAGPAASAEGQQGGQQQQQEGEQQQDGRQQDDDEQQRGAQPAAVLPGNQEQQQQHQPAAPQPFQQQQQDDDAGPSSAHATAVPSAPDAAGPSTSSSKAQLGEQEVDKSVLAELPPEIQREIRSQLKMQQMLDRSKRSSSGPSQANGSGSSSHPGSGGKRGAAAPQQGIKAFLKGKRPKM